MHLPYVNLFPFPLMWPLKLPICPNQDSRQDCISYPSPIIIITSQKFTWKQRNLLDSGKGGLPISAHRVCAK